MKELRIINFFLSFKSVFDMKYAINIFVSFFILVSSLFSSLAYANTAPVLTTKGKNIQGEQFWGLDNLISYSDANGDSVVKYQIQHFRPSSV